MTNKILFSFSYNERRKDTKWKFYFRAGKFYMCRGNQLPYEIQESQVISELTHMLDDESQFLAMRYDIRINRSELLKAFGTSNVLKIVNEV